MGPFAQVKNNAIVSVGTLPIALANSTTEQREAQGWFRIDMATNPRPADTAETTWIPWVILSNGRPTLYWEENVKSPEQVEEAQLEAQAVTLRTQILAAYARLEEIGNYQPPVITNANALAELTKTMAAVQDIAKMMQGMARLELGKYFET